MKNKLYQVVECTESDVLARNEEVSNEKNMAKLSATQEAHESYLYFDFLQVVLRQLYQPKKTELSDISAYLDADSTKPFNLDKQLASQDDDVAMNFAGQYFPWVLAFIGAYKKKQAALQAQRHHAVAFVIGRLLLDQAVLTPNNAACVTPQKLTQQYFKMRSVFAYLKSHYAVTQEEIACIYEETFVKPFIAFGKEYETRFEQSITTVNSASLRLLARSDSPKTRVMPSSPLRNRPAEQTHDSIIKNASRFFTQTHEKHNRVAETCRELLEDYVSRGSFFCGLINLSFGRHHVKRVKTFLDQSGSEASVVDIRAGLEDAAVADFILKEGGDLFKILQYCAALESQDDEIASRRALFALSAGQAVQC
jgi:hypothetical protein